MIIIVIRLFETSQDGTPSAIVKTLLPAAFHHLHAYLEHSPVGGVTRVLFNAFPISPVLIGLISRVYLLLSCPFLFLWRPHPSSLPYVCCVSISIIVT
jgi:hypothetical protein